MFVNLHTLPADQAMYSIAVTDDALEREKSERWADEVDWVGSTRITAREVVRRARQDGSLDGYDGCRVVGVINQSDGYVMIEDWSGIE